MNRELMVRAYAILMPLAALSVVVQAILFAGRYSEGQAWYLTAHMHVGSASLLIVVVCLGLAIFGRFPQATRYPPADRHPCTALVRAVPAGRILR